eukprot:m.307174 g.307174  ORF g.307174 m.307174 type:complete len:675 (+) comp41984_c0_seq1:894-2918(+)
MMMILSTNGPQNYHSQQNSRTDDSDYDDVDDPRRDIRNRVDSFKHWPSFGLAITKELAQEGFSYTGIRDQVCCYGCGILVDGWKSPYKPFKRHAKASPNCAFVVAFEKAESRKEGATETPPEDRPGDSLVARFDTFKGWPTSCPVSPEELAQAGFYYHKGKEDTVECYVCHVVLKHWKVGDTACGEHRRYSPYCPLITGSLPTASSKSPPSAHASSPPSKPSHYFTDEQKRRETFANWPRTVPVGIGDLAEAGFLYTGRGDEVRCFECGVSVQRWVPGDVPIHEHIKASPDCTFAQSLLKKNDIRESVKSPEPTGERMNTYDERIATFETWPAHLKLSPHRLANAGFYYGGQKDKVTCYSCGGRLQGWEWGDDPWTEHKKHFSNCNLVREHFGASAAEESYDEPWHQLKERGFNDQYNEEPFPLLAAPARHPPQLGEEEERRGGGERMGSYQERFATFDNFPKPFNVSPRRLAKAGFFYSGRKDKVTCFSCGGQLQRWERGDDPWTEHRDRFPHCNLVREHFGGAIVDESYDEPWHQPVQLPFVESNNGLPHQQAPLEQQPIDFVSKAIEMGFTREKVLRVAERHAGVEQGFDAFVSALMDEPDQQQVPAEVWPIAPSMDVADRFLCKVCMEREANALFLPCAHVVCCCHCGSNLQNCPICRKPIQSKIQTYFS